MLTKDQIIKGISLLSRDDQNEILDQLIRELDVEAGSRTTISPSSIEWTKELDSRIDRFERGESTAASWPEVDARLERLLAELGDRASPQ